MAQHEETDRDKLARLERENEALRRKERMTRLPAEVEALSTAASSLALTLAHASRCEDEDQLIEGLHEAGRKARTLSRDISQRFDELSSEAKA